MPHFKCRTSGWRDPAASSWGAAPSCWVGCGGPAAGRQTAWAWPGPARRPCGLLSAGRCGPDSSLHPPGSWTGTQRDTEVRGQKPETSSQAHIIYCRNEQERNCCMWKKTSKFHIYNLKFDLFSYKSRTRITCTDLQLLQGSSHGDKGLLHQWLNYFGSLNVKRRPWLLLWLPAHCVNVTAKIELCHRHLCPVLVLRLHYI